jgi:hypothetical protein
MSSPHGQSYSAVTAMTPAEAIVAFIPHAHGTPTADRAAPQYTTAILPLRHFEQHNVISPHNFGAMIRFIILPISPVSIEMIDRLLYRDMILLLMKKYVIKF